MFGILGNSRFRICLLFLLLTPFTCGPLFVCGSCKRIKDGRKETSILLDSNFILGCTIFKKWFSRNSRNSRISQTRRMKYIKEPFSAIKSLRVVACLVSMFIRGCN